MATSSIRSSSAMTTKCFLAPVISRFLSRAINIATAAITSVPLGQLDGNLNKFHKSVHGSKVNGSRMDFRWWPVIRFVPSDCFDGNLVFLVHSIVGRVRGAISCIDNAVDVICIVYIHDGYGPDRKDSQ